MLAQKLPTEPPHDLAVGASNSTKRLNLDRLIVQLIPDSPDKAAGEKRARSHGRQHTPKHRRARWHSELFPNPVQTIGPRRPGGFIRTGHSDGSGLFINAE